MQVTVDGLSCDALGLKVLPGADAIVPEVAGNIPERQVRSGSGVGPSSKVRRRSLMSTGELARAKWRRARCRPS